MQGSDTELYGKLTIKVRLGDDVRRMQILNEAITYDELLLMLQRVFRGKLKDNGDLTLKYKDEDGDMITIDSNTDLSLAIRISPVLKLEIFDVPDNISTSTLGATQILKLREEIQDIRDKATRILDRLQLVSNEKQSSEDKNAPVKQQPPKIPEAKEFDPLQKPEVSNGAVEMKEVPAERREATPVARPPSAQSQYPMQTQQHQPPVSYHQNVQVPPSQTPQLQQPTAVAPQLQHTVSQYQSNMPSAAAGLQQYGSQYPPTQAAQSYQSLPAGYPTMNYSLQSQQQQPTQAGYPQYNQQQQGPPKMDNLYRQGDMSNNPYSKQPPPSAIGGYRPTTQYQ